MGKAKARDRPTDKRLRLRDPFARGEGERANSMQCRDCIRKANTIPARWLLFRSRGPRRHQPLPRTEVGSEWDRSRAEVPTLGRNIRSTQLSSVLDERPDARSLRRRCPGEHSTSRAVTPILAGTARTSRYERTSTTFRRTSCRRRLRVIDHAAAPYWRSFRSGPRGVVTRRSDRRDETAGVAPGAGQVSRANISGGATQRDCSTA